MKLRVTILALFFSTVSFSQNTKTAAYIEQYKEIAIQEMIRSGVPASITLAQAVLESQSGESDLVKRSNNHFGIKCKPEWTGARTYHDDDAKGECFRVYDNPEASFKDHSDFLRTRAHYQFLFKLAPTDSEGWAKGLKKAGYATLPTYPQKLIKIINEYNLNQYNTMALARLNQAPQKTDKVDAEMYVKPPIENNSSGNSSAIIIKPIVEEEPSTSETYIPGAGKTEVKRSSKYGSANFPEGLFTINQTNVVFAKAGTSLLALANQYNISLGQLLNYNEMQPQDILAEDELIFLERKQKKGEQAFHIVQPGQTLLLIAQLNGVRLDQILLYNKIEKNIQPTAGSKVYLKSPVANQSTPNKK